MHPTLRLAAALLAASAAAVPAAAQTVTPDTSFFAHIARNARARAQALAAGARVDPRVQAQHTEALAELERGAWADAGVTLQAILQRARNNPLYLGDLAYSQARQAAWADAHNGYLAAYRAQQQNAWYLVGLAAVRGAQSEWAEAAGTLALATQNDSTVVDARVAPVGAHWFEQAGDRLQSLSWSRMAVARAPGDAPSWLRIALFLRALNDSTTEGPRAIDRYLALRPGDRLGSAVLADHLYNAGRTDSALALAAHAAQDSAYREFAAEMYLAAARPLLIQRDMAKLFPILERGRPWATPAQQPGYANLLGRAQLLRGTELMQRIETRPDCDTARLADTLFAQAERNLRAGVSFDSARTVMFIDQVVPSYRRQSAQAVETSCRAPARTPARPAPRRRP